jgi:hypothetical protein
MLPIRHFSEGFNTGNVAMAKSAFLKTGIVILDEVPPHVWSGAGAVDMWLKDLVSRDTKDGVTDSRVEVGKPLVETSNATTGYVVASVEYLYKQRGKAIHEPATMTFAQKKVGGAGSFRDGHGTERYQNPAHNRVSTGERLPVREVRLALPDFYNIAVRIANIARENRIFWNNTTKTQFL